HLDPVLYSVDDYLTSANITSYSLVNGGLCRSGVAGEDDLVYSPAAVIPSLWGGWLGGGGGRPGDEQDACG
ncbi:MAG: hypothetical protein ACRDTJ_23950, partial [Pseudonocardiaceae bacterium]